MGFDWNPLHWGSGNLAGAIFGGGDPLLGYVFGGLSGGIDTSLNNGGIEDMARESAEAAKAENDAAMEDLSQNDPFSVAAEAMRSRSYLDTQGRRGYRDTYLIGARGIEGQPWPKSTLPNWKTMDLPSWIQTPAPTPGFRTAPPPGSVTAPPPGFREAPPPNTADNSDGGGSTPAIEPLDMEPIDVWVGRGAGRRHRA
jgi:hypothetical protein